MPGDNSMNSLCEIKWFAERDIDVLLAEELRVNPIFARWFLDAQNVNSQVEVPAVRTSVSEMDGRGRETDVLALFGADKENRHAVLVENKIEADFQPNQLEDYLNRGRRGVDEKSWGGFSVAVFAPTYRNLNVPAGVSVVRFADAARALRSSGRDDRTLYRAEFLEAADSMNIVSVEAVNPFVVAWWKSVDEMVAREFGNFFIVDRQRFPKTTYINPKCIDMPKYLRVDLKGDKGTVGIAIVGGSEEKLRGLIAQTQQDEFEVVRGARDKDPSLQISGLPKFFVNDGIEIIDSKVRVAYQAAHKLLTFWMKNRTLFDDVIGS